MAGQETHTRLYRKPEFNDDPFSDEGLLCPNCKTAHGVSIEGSSVGIGTRGLEVINEFSCSNCKHVFYVAIFKSKWDDCITFDLAKAKASQVEVEDDPIAALEAPHPGAKDFGTWVLSGDQLVLRTDETRAVDLESCNCSAQILDWIFHYRDRLTHQEMADILQAFESILHPRQNYCGDGVDKGADPLLLLDQWLNPKPQRKPIKPSVRFQILKRDGYRCQMCGATAKDGATLEIDHITPVSEGGTNDPENLQVLCRDCNAGKSDHLL